MSAVAAVIAVIGAYLLGTFPTALMVGRRYGFDPTAEGSGNPGASNTTRIGGAKAGALVLVGDAGKGILAAGIGYAVDGRTLAWFAGAAAVAGHLWPITRKLRGGKGVATAGGVALVCAPLASLILAMLFAAMVKIFGKAAIGSMTTAILLPFAVAARGQEPVEIAVAAAVGVVVLLRHRENLGRILRGTESGLRR